MLWTAFTPCVSRDLQNNWMSNVESTNRSLTNYGVRTVTWYHTSLFDHFYRGISCLTEQAEAVPARPIRRVSITTGWWLKNITGPNQQQLQISRNSTRTSSVLEKISLNRTSTGWKSRPTHPEPIGQLKNTSTRNKPGTGSGKVHVKSNVETPVTAKILEESALTSTSVRDLDTTVDWISDSNGAHRFEATSVGGGGGS